ncbi:hypothetical protein [Lysinibacillus sp. NPDC056232]|uniref:hypothetical protein n=1 Tax=Lysinibacillus sp. NPDC056232 TaxID=3345756 RepID=UPI0035D67A21
MSFARKRSANEASAKCFCLCESVVQRSDSNSTMLVTKALSQDVMVLVFVPLLLIPKESPSRNEDQPIHLACII